MPNCDCGACCDTCGHDDGCISREAPMADPSDDYGLYR